MLEALVAWDVAMYPGISRILFQRWDIVYLNWIIFAKNAIVFVHQ